MTPEELIDDPDFIGRLLAELNDGMPTDRTFGPEALRFCLREALGYARAKEARRQRDS